MNDIKDGKNLSLNDHERTITEPEVLTLIQEYFHKFYRTSGSALDIKEAYEGR